MIFEVDLEIEHDVCDCVLLLARVKFLERVAGIQYPNEERSIELRRVDGTVEMRARGLNLLVLLYSSIRFTLYDSVCYRPTLN